MIDAAFIVLIGFISFIAIAFRYGYKKSLAGLDQQIAEISLTVEKANQALLQAKEKHSYETQYSSLIENEINEIYKRIQHQIEEIRAQAAIDFEKAMQARTLNADSLMDRQRKEVIDALQNHITTAAIKVLEELFTNHLPAKIHNDINSASLTKLKTVFQNTTKEDAKDFIQKKIVNGN